MGSSSWSSSAFRSYSATRGRSVTVDGIASSQNMFTEKRLAKELNPYGVVRECCDSEEHPNTIPVILALDVTGSMGESCRRVAQSLNKIMENLYTSYKDIEFLIMGIGDLAYDSAPIQASQYESDIRIAEQTDKIYFEGGGGGNSYESYTAAWYFGLYRTKLDCWKRGKKGIIITLGDEPMNPYLPKAGLQRALGSCANDTYYGQISADGVDTKDLYKEVVKKFDIFHIAVDDSDDCYSRYKNAIKVSWGNLLGQRFVVSTLENLSDTIADCIGTAINANGGVVAGDTESFVNPIGITSASSDSKETFTELESDEETIPTFSW